RDVTKRDGAKLAVDRLTLTVPPGEMFAFLGPNGAGKTTTIKMLCGLLFPTSGTVRVGGFDVQTDGDQARQLIAYVPDTPFLYEKLTGREFLQFIADMYGMPREHGRARIEAMIATFGLGPLVDDLTAPYSHGKTRRVVACGTLAELREQGELEGTLEEVFLTLAQEEVNAQPWRSCPSAAPLAYRPQRRAPSAEQLARPAPHPRLVHPGARRDGL